MRFASYTKETDCDFNTQSLHDLLHQLELSLDETRFDDDGDEI